MKQKFVLSVLTASVILTGICFGQIEVVHNTGVGTRAYALGNNFVALSNDQSGMYYNPAGLAFVPSREFQISLDVLSQRANTDFNGESETSVVQRLRLANIGYLHAFPTSQGGFTMAAAFQSPITFDDVRKFSGNYQTLPPLSKTVNVSRDETNYGALNYWIGSFGLQVAEGLGIGASVSFVSGGEDGRNIFYRDTAGHLGDSLYDDYDRTVSRSYAGYDVRLGLLYNFAKRFNFGVRVVLPQTVWFTEDMTEVNPHSPSFGEYTYPTAKGRLFSSYSGAAGVSGTFSFLTFTTEFRARAPYTFAYPAERIPSTSLAAKTVYGAGIGLEVPVFVNTTLFRAGYSWDQFDTHFFASQYDDPKLPANWDPQGEVPKGDQHLITLGLAFLMKNACLEFSYGYNFWSLETNNILTEDHAQNRVVASLSFRF